MYVQVYLFIILYSYWIATNIIQYLLYLVVLCEQNGFRHGWSCADHLSTLAQIIDSRKKRNQSTFIAFIDLCKAYDRISRPLLWRKLKQSGVSQKFLQAIQSLYKDVKCSVKINGHHSEWFNVSVGLKQGCLISPMLFNLYIDDLISET